MKNKELVNHRFESPWPVRLSALGLLILLVLAGLYWKERVIMVDAAFQVFSVITRADLAIQVQRFGAAIVQMWPLLGVKMGLPLPWVLASYSLGFQLYPLLFFGILLWWVKHERLAVAFALYYLLLMTHTFFWVQSELIQGSAAALLTVGIALKPGRLPLFISLLLAIAVVYWHPLAVAPLLFSWGYFYLRDQRQRQWSYYAVPAVAILTLAYKHFLANTGQYDATAMGMADGFQERFMQLFSLPSVQHFKRHLLHTYWLYVPAMLGVSIFYGRTRQWYLMAWLWLGTLAWLALILTTYHWGAEQFYIESYYLPLGLFVALPLACDWMPRWSHRTIIIVFVLILGLRTGKIIDAFQRYHDRLFWVQQTVTWLRTFPEERFLMRVKDAPLDKLKMEWASPYETLLVSALPHPDSALCLYITHNDAPLGEWSQLDQACAGPFGLITYSELNQTGYFVMKDTLPAVILGQ